MSSQEYFSCLPKMYTIQCSMHFFENFRRQFLTALCRDKILQLKGAQAWDIRYRVIYTERSHLGRRLEE